MQKRIFWGLLAGIIGGLAGAAILWGSWLLPSLGLLLTRVDIVNGASALLVFGAVGGVLYALVIGDSKLRLGNTIVAGLVLGILLWFLGILIVVPLILGFPPQLRNPLDHWTPLLAFSLYGVIVALLYSRWALHQPVRRSYIALGLLVLSIFLAPVMLRAAVSTKPEDLKLPQGYRAEVVAKGFTYPTSLLIDAKQNVYVAEAGYAYGPKTAIARIIKVEAGGNMLEIARDFEGPINGLALKENKLFVSHRGKITELDLDSKERKDLIRGLPSLGDHQNNDLLFGQDGALYFGQGTATNAGVVGSDNFIYAWADRYPDFHDVPSRDFVLTGENYAALDLGTPDPSDKKTTGAFAPFGQQREDGEEVEGSVPAGGAIHRYDLEKETLSIYADGLRNPYGLALGAEGELFATNLGYDDRGERAVKGSPEWVVKVEEGAWYGWPDFAGKLPLTDERFASDRGINRNPLIKEHPAVEPPLAELPSHYSPMKLDFAPEGFKDQGLFVAVFGDAQPLTEDLAEQVPTGVIIVDPESGEYEWFVKNKNKPRGGRWGDGFKRVIDVKFAEGGGAMYVLDFGVMEFTDFSPNAIPRSGVLWKIVPDAGVKTPPVAPKEKAPPGKKGSTGQEQPEIKNTGEKGIEKQPEVKRPEGETPDKPKTVQPDQPEEQEKPAQPEGPDQVPPEKPGGQEPGTPEPPPQQPEPGPAQPGEIKPEQPGQPEQPEQPGQQEPAPPQKPGQQEVPNPHRHGTR